MASADYLFYGSAPWDSPWLTEHNLADSLAKRGNRVLFVEPPISIATPLRRGRGSAARRLLRRGTRIDRGAAVVQPLVLPPITSHRAQALSAPLLRAQIRAAVRRLGFDRPVAISTREVSSLAGAVDEQLRIYLVKDWIQAGASLLGRSQSELVREVDAMTRWADIVCAISPQLRDGLAAEGIDSTVLRHGFHSDLAELYEGCTVPPDLLPLARPLLGYAGRIDDRLDIELLTKLARHFGDGTLLLLGPISPRFPRDQRRLLEREPNIALLGARNREELPAYLSALDCSLMPYRTTEWLKYGSPLKLWDLLYAGPPIVGSGCVSLQEYAPRLLDFATDHDRFVEGVEKALLTGRAGEADRRRCALENDWDTRASQLERLVDDLQEAGHASQTDV